MTKRKGYLLGFLVMAVSANLLIHYGLAASSPQTVVRIKVENDGGIINGFSPAAAAGPAFDPYFVQVNHIEHIKIPH